MSHYRHSRAAGATYFFTVALADRSAALLTEHIEALRRAFRIVRQQRAYKTMAICVLPDHLHAIWELPADDADYSTRRSQIKSAFSRTLPPSPSRSASKTNKREKGIWQRRYWEHQIRDEEDLQRHVDYLHYNPVKHGLVGHVKDWPYSSFHRYVERGWLPLTWAGGAEDELSTAAGERI